MQQKSSFSKQDDDIVSEAELNYSRLQNKGTIVPSKIILTLIMLSISYNHNMDTALSTHQQKEIVCITISSFDLNLNK